MLLSWQYCLKLLWLIPAMNGFRMLSMYSKARLGPFCRFSRLTSCQELLKYLSPIHGLLLMRQRSHSSSSGSFTTRLYSTNHQFLNHSETIISTIDSSSVLDNYMEELVRLRGTPELVDRLENLASKHPGLEMDINLFRSLYSFKLDQFQEEGLLELISGNIISPPLPSTVPSTMHTSALLL